MNGKTAKLLRRYIYKDRVTSSLGRTYTQDGTGAVHADPLRQQYQHLKKAWKERKIV